MQSCSVIDAFPLTIWYAPNGGAAEKAKRLAGRVLARGTTVGTIDSVGLLKGLTKGEHVMFVMSNACKGEPLQDGCILCRVAK